MAAQNERTGKKAASSAGKTLANPNATKAQKAAAASALSQTGNRKVTGKKAASSAGKTLGNPKASKAQKAAAASALTQRASKLGRR